MKTYQLSPKIELIQKKILSIIECISIGTEMKGETSCRQFSSRGHLPALERKRQNSFRQRVGGWLPRCVISGRARIWRVCQMLFSRRLRGLQDRSQQGKSHECPPNPYKYGGKHGRLRHNLYRLSHLVRGCAHARLYISRRLWLFGQKNNPLLYPWRQRVSHDI